MGIKKDDTLRTSAELSIGQIIANAKKAERRIEAELPRAVELLDVARAIVEAARAADKRVRKLRSIFSLPKLRFYVVVIAVGLLFWWVYANFLTFPKVLVASTFLESTSLRNQAEKNNAGRIEFPVSNGTVDSIQMVKDGDADLAIVQAGMPGTSEFTNLGVVRHEHVLFFARTEIVPDDNPLTVLTFNEGQGSHTLAQEFFRFWGFRNVNFVFDWDILTTNDTYRIAQDIEAVFLVVDPADSNMHGGIDKVVRAGLSLQDADIGVIADRFPQLQPLELQPGYYNRRYPQIPDKLIRTYTVDNYLVAGPNTSSRKKQMARMAFDFYSSEIEIPTNITSPTSSSIIQELSNVFSLGINLFVVIVALFGVEILRDRKYIHELNRYISCISLLQADLDLIGTSERKVLETTTVYLESCADLLGIISAIGGFYGQEMAALVFNGLTGQIHVRANDLKINIRLKVLHLGTYSSENFIAPS